MELRRASTILGCGCAVVVALLLGTVVAVTWTTYRAGKDFARIARDPEAAAEKAREVVGFSELPPGYRAYGSLSVPLLLDVAFFLSPAEAEAAPAAAANGVGAEEPLAVDRGFLYVRLRDWMSRGDELQEALGGTAADEAPVVQQGLEFDPSEVVARGTMTSGVATVTWLARRGEVKIDPDGFGGVEAEVSVDDGDLREVVYQAPEAAAGTEGDEPVPGVLTVLTFDCPGDDAWQRLGVWFAPDPAPDQPVAAVDWRGGPGDPAAIADLLARFELCG